jgi:hypothetical protein
MKVIERLMVLAVVVSSVFTLSSCESTDNNSARHYKGESVVTADIENLHTQPSQIYCACNDMPGRELVFDLAVENSAKATRTVYAFVWATNDEVSPPERGLWPVAAVDSCLTSTGELNVTDYTSGTEVSINGQGSVTVPGNSILEPAVHYKGQLVEFRKLRIELWSRTGNRIFQKTIDRR